jgi:hypothetical protein
MPAEFQSMQMEKYRIIGSRDFGTLNIEINKLADDGFRPVMMQTAMYAPTEKDLKGQQLGGTLEIIVLMQRGD